jgi:type IV secretory pathway TrbF-like protein
MEEMKKIDNRIIDGGYSSNEVLSEANNHWKKVAIVLGALLLVICVYLGMKGQAEKRIPENIVKHHLAKYVIHMRTVSMDPVVTRTNLEEAYAFTTLKAKKQLDRVLMDINFSDKHTEKIVVTVSIQSIVLKSKAICVVSWTETVYKDSMVISAVDYNGFFKLKYQPVRKDVNPFPVNPSGVYVDNILIEKSTEQQR